MQGNFHAEIGQLVSEIREEFDITHFVETGTNVGVTAEGASEEFDQVITIEFDTDLNNQALQKRGHIENIDFVKGKSQEKLKEIVPELDGPAVFHLDAHCGGKWSKSAGETLEEEGLHECPLLEELEIMSDGEHTHFIFIDDARVFTSPRREPFNADEWPTLQEIIHKLEEMNPEYDVIIFKDEIIAVPPEASSFVRDRIRDYKSIPRTRINRLKFWILNKVWYHASLSGPTRG